MTETEALNAIDDLCPFGEDPTISTTSQQRLLALASTIDVDGLSPTDEGWTPTYDMRGVYVAAREGWTMKAGRVVGRFDFATDGQSFKRSQFASHIAERIAHFNRKIQSATSTA